MDLRELTQRFIASLPGRPSEELDVAEARIRAVLALQTAMAPGYRRAATEALRAIARERLRRAFR